MAKQTTDEKHEDAAMPPTPEQKPHCGIIMPISDSPGYDPGHWLEVRRLIVRAADAVGYTAGMVSENDGQDVIHRSIVKNIYHNELVVCDVSSLNPNVMLELGLRMANKKPLIVIFDGEGVYPFDIKNMLYIPYPKGLHHFKVENFVQELTARMVQVTEAAKANKYEPFLNHFNDVVIEESQLGTTKQNMAETLASLVDEIKSVKSDIKILRGNKRAANDSVTIKSVLFETSEIQYIQGVAFDIYMVNNKLPLNPLIDLVYSNVLNTVSNKASLLYNPEFVRKLEDYKTTAFAIIHNSLIDILRSHI